MNRIARIITTALTLGVAPGLITWTAVPCHAWAEEDQIRADIAKPLKEVQDLARAKDYRKALERLRDIDIQVKTPTERGIVEQLRFAIAAGLNDGPTAAQAYETLVSSGRLQPTDQARFQFAVLVAYYQSKDYGNAAQWGRKVLAAGANPDALNLTAQSYYLVGDYTQTARTLQPLLSPGEHPTEVQLRLLAESYQRIKDRDGAFAATQRLVADYPKPDYWQALIATLASRPLGEHLALDIARLKFALGLISSTEDYVNLAELAIQAGLPGEAKAAIDQGFSKGILGTGPEAERHTRLKLLAIKKVTDDQADLAKSEADGEAAKDGNALVATGLDWLGYGKAEKAAKLIQAGIDKGGLKSTDEARLHLGIALLKAGKRSEAVDVLKSIKGADGIADLAKLWLTESASSS